MQAATAAAAERLRRHVQRTRSAPPQESPPAPLPEHLDSAAYWGAARAPSEAGDQRQGQGSYLAPVPQAPTWEQVVPTATPWSVAPKLPSATSWGDIINGIDCHTSGGNLHCLTPGGRQVTVPAKGLPDGIRFAPGQPYYHYYSTPDGPVRFDPQALTQGMIDRPTPGHTSFVRPATPQGTLNEATPLVGFQPPITPVTSYVTADQNGTPVVVNVTQPRHLLHPGVVIRYVTTSPSGSTIQNEGTGLAPIQAPGSWFENHLSNAWRGLSQDIMNETQHGRDKSSRDK